MIVRDRSCRGNAATGFRATGWRGGVLQDSAGAIRSPSDPTRKRPRAGPDDGNRGPFSSAKASVRPSMSCRRQGARQALRNDTLPIDRPAREAMTGWMPGCPRPLCADQASTRIRSRPAPTKRETVSQIPHRQTGHPARMPTRGPSHFGQKDPPARLRTPPTLVIETTDSHCPSGHRTNHPVRSRVTNPQPPLAVAQTPLIGLTALQRALGAAMPHSTQSRSLNREPTSRMGDTDTGPVAIRVALA
jgi:hypothetical protein